MYALNSSAKRNGIRRGANWCCELDINRQDSWGQDSNKRDLIR